LSGATPGIHFPHSRTYIRRIRISENSPLLVPIMDAGYHVEDDVMAGSSTKVVSIPI